MSALTIETLKELIEHLPSEYTVEYKNNEDIITPLGDVVEIDVGNQRIILKK